MKTLMRKRDADSPFRYHLSNLLQHGKEVTVTIDDLRRQWVKQGGICPYTGWRLKNASATCDRLPRTPDRASLDRIDSSRGYLPDNIQFVSLMAQFAKNSWPESELLRFAAAVANHRGPRGRGGVLSLLHLKGD